MMVPLYDVILLFSSAVAFWRAHTGGNLRAPTQGDGVRGRVRAERRVAGHRGRVLERGSHPLQPQDARRVPIRRSSHRKKPTKQIIKQTTETVKNLFLPPARPFSAPDHQYAAELGHAEDLEEEQDLDGLDDVEAFQTDNRARSVVKADEELNKEAYFKLSGSFLSNVLTHVILVQNEHLLQKLKLEIRNLATRASKVTPIPNPLIKLIIHPNAMLAALAQ